MEVTAATYLRQHLELIGAVLDLTGEGPPAYFHQAESGSAQRWRARVRHDETWLGMQPTFKEIEICGCIWLLADGSVQNYVDWTYPLAQLGATPTWQPTVTALEGLPSFS